MRYRRILRKDLNNYDAETGRRQKYCNYCTR